MVTVAAKRAWLGRYGEAEREVDRLCEEMVRWASRAQRVTACLGPMPHAKSGVPGMVLAVEKMDEVQRRLAERMQAVQAVQEEIEAAIAQLEGGNVRAVMRMRHVEQLRWDEVASRMGMVRQWVQKLEARGVEALEV